MNEDGELKMWLSVSSLVYVVPKEVRGQIFEEAHSGLLADRFSFDKLYSRLKMQIFWHGMIQDTRKWSCERQQCFLHNIKVTSQADS